MPAREIENDGADEPQVSPRQPTEEERRLQEVATGSLSVIASDTFGWIDPAVAHSPLTRRDRREVVTRLGVAALWWSAVGLIISWFGPWGAAPAAVGIVLGIVALLRPTERRRWCWSGIALGMTAIAFSAYWLLWMLPQLGAIDPVL
ncbi:hypothetical protein [Microbacterium amylolyticum]|uniref:DUF4190 domain-containing protein n=1 Tax=Microbacterium amylolyticum TaxID=936337 RepID=A0ABS4ZJF0_9MICO|nr:hypothetical protein [Microbacterium amylolyticum]MBP2437404.1 hypothetical protein [Microbacterium amylolyticum]